MNRILTASIPALAAAAFLVPAAQAAPLGIVNGGFETGTVNTQVIPGWNNSGVTSSTVAGTDYGFFLTSGRPGSPDPETAPEGAQFLTASRPGDSVSPGSSSGTATLTQSIDVSSLAAVIAPGSSTFSLSFVYQAQDNTPSFPPGDFGSVTADFLGAAGSNLGSSSFSVDPLNPSLLRDGLITATVPAGTSSVLLTVTASRGGNSQTNVSYDNFVGDISAVPEPASLGLLGLGGLALLRRRRA